jgi:hypothetical protein
MPHAPVDVLVAEFKGGEFHGQMASALTDLVERNLIHIIDLVFVRKDEEGTVTLVELDDLGDLGSVYGSLEGEYGGLLSDSDIAAATADLEPGTAAGLLVWENVWAADFVAALRSAGGQVVAYERIASDAVEDAFAGID